MGEYIYICDDKFTIGAIPRLLSATKYPTRHQESRWNKRCVTIGPPAGLAAVVGTHKKPQSGVSVGLTTTSISEWFGAVIHTACLVVFSSGTYNIRKPTVGKENPDEKI